MKLTTEQLLQLADHQFTLQAPMKALWQILADNFYPERADYTITRNVGSEFADGLMDSYPLLMRRDLGNSLSAMLRDGDWFSMGIEGEDPDYAGVNWLQEKTKLLRKLMYRTTSGFVRASAEGDQDYVTFGQCVKSVEVNRLRDGLLFRCWHMRDCAWFEDENGQVCGLVRQGMMTRRDMVSFFGKDNVAPQVTQNLDREPFVENKVMHLNLPSSMVGDEKILERNQPYVSIWIDVNNKKEMERQGMTHKTYVVPRFQTIAGSAYAYSPATTVGLSNARCLQAMTHTLLETAERYARPPLIATVKAVRGDVDLAADGITWVDEEYDERLGGALRPLTQNQTGFPIGNSERERVADALNSAFYLNKLNMPDVNHEMTAYEVSERMKQFRRENLPLFAPIEAEDNGRTCELAFEVAMSNGMLGSAHDIPPSLRGKGVRFRFISPLTQSENEERAQRFKETREMLGSAMDLDPSVGHDVDLSVALRDAIVGTGAPTRWLRDPEVAAERRQEDEVKQMAQQALEAAG